MSDALADPIQRRLPDGGPVYVETPANLSDFPGWAAEPWNTGSACLFVLIALVWAWLLKGRYRQYPFLTMCVPILLTGGIGGVLFHGLRQHRAYFLMDVIPIFLLGLFVALWIWIRLGPKIRHLLGVMALLAFLQLVARVQLPPQSAINVSYACLAFMVLLPIVLALVRTKFRYAGWIYTAFACFAIALLCRFADTTRPPLLPMGTHWLWHVFGACTTVALSMYVYRIEGISLRSENARVSGNPTTPG
ncbi:MAG: hypothetical protein K8T89_26980 [Planctomycetes bacterium]|nr:hypothetical protein [Planctomycetota bacterium]